MKPVIGITVNYSYNGDSECAEGIGVAGQEWQLLADDYVTAVLRAGGVPVMLPVVRDQEVMKEMLGSVDGVLFSGGSDVDPQLFGQTTFGKTGAVIAERDAQEAAMVEYVVNQTQKPVLGICRGIQIINAALGGTLLQHVPDAGFHNHTLTMYPRYMASHKVDIVPDSILAKAVGTEKLATNSFHHMAVDACAPCLKVVARSEDGVSEAVELAENPNGRYLLAVQWHPEMMSAVNPTQQAIINSFVQACQK